MRINQRKTEKDDKKTAIEQIDWFSIDTSKKDIA